MWAQNLFNENYLQVGFDAPVQGSGTTRGVQAGFYPASTQLYGGFLGEPRTFGVTLHGKATFDAGRAAALCRSAGSAAAPRAGDPDLRRRHGHPGDRRLPGAAASAAAAATSGERG